MHENVAVVGSGSWGTTIAKILGDNNVPTLLWARREDACREINETRQNEKYLPGARLGESIRATHDLQEVCERCKAIVMVVPSHGVRQVAFDMGHYLTGEHVMVHAVKGIEVDTFKRISEILREETCVKKIGVLSGPNLARELAAQQPAGTLVASRFNEVFKRFHKALHNNYFRVYGGRDVVGAEVGGAFKNIVALAAGIVDGLGLGDNTKALLLTRGMAEMGKLGAAMGADLLTFGGMAGIGDLMATCASPLSRNHQVGERLAKGETLEQIRAAMFMVAEGVKTTRAVHAYAQYKGLDLHIVAAVHRLLYEGATVPEAIRDLMAVPTGAEFDGNLR
ncbi:MAG: NAD(P)-dependent glycerol-3-phosphate dehydrogenase [Myxococcales bacterium]|nr:NAD(P)-dependent glycerol-3-phosphate dehydrogenase [Myxococcales bacterium]